MASVGVAFAGLVVLSACAVKVFLALRDLGRELERTRRLLEPAQLALRSELRNLQRAGGPDTPRDGVRST
jgi:hypothetical protein